MERAPNPLVTEVRDSPNDLPSDTVYLIHSASLAAELYPDFNYFDQFIGERIYWFETDDELDRIISLCLSVVSTEPRLVVNLDDLTLSGDTFYSNQDGRMYILNSGCVWHADLHILSVIHRMSVTSEYLIEDGGIGFDKIQIVLMEMGLLDEMYTEHSYTRYLAKLGFGHVLPLIYEFLWRNRPEVVYDIDGPYDNPYENIIFVERYLTDQHIHNIDLDKCVAYDLKCGKLPAKYRYSGLHTTTGRIYCNSDEYPTLPNLNKSKRDILYASPGHLLIEIDFKSFEFDLLSQILGLKVVEDPHTAIFDRLVGIDVPNRRGIGKTINYSFIYGMNPGRLADQILNEIPELDRSFRDVIIERLGDEEIIEPLMDFDARLHSGAKRGIIQNFFCRNIYFKKDHAILSNYISSTAADFLYIKFRHAADLIAGVGSIVLENHDSILLHLPESFIETDSFDELLDMMREPVSGLRGRIDFTYGKNWKDMV